MKTTSLIAALSLVMVSVSFAAEPNMAVVNGKENVMKVIYRAEAAENVRLKIYNQDGEVVFAETIKGKSGFILPVNFEGLPYGEYTVEIVGNSTKKSQKVIYSQTRVAELIQAQAVVKGIHVAKMTTVGKYLLTVANEGKQKINVRIYDGANNLVHNSNSTINGNFGLIYNLEKIIGVPTFEVTANSGTVTIQK